MSENLSEFERLLGHAALRLWSELPREVQENVETAVPLDAVIRNRLAIFLHDRHPRTADPPKPTQLAWLFWYNDEAEITIHAARHLWDGRMLLRKSPSDGRTWKICKLRRMVSSAFRRRYSNVVTSTLYQLSGLSKR
jgi:hypothetical protein